MLEVRIRIMPSMNPTLWWVQWKSSTSEQVHGHACTGMDAMRVILQALKYLHRKSW